MHTPNFIIWIFLLTLKVLRDDTCVNFMCFKNTSFLVLFLDIFILFYFSDNSSFLPFKNVEATVVTNNGNLGGRRGFLFA